MNADSMLLDPDLSFRRANGAALFGWLALGCSPGRVRWTSLARRVAGRWLPLVMVLRLTLMLGPIGRPSFATLKPREALS